MSRMCIICKERKATVPDRNTTGRPIAMLCSACHRERLRNDMIDILDDHRKKEARRRGGK